MRGDVGVRGKRGGEAGGGVDHIESHVLLIQGIPGAWAGGLNYASTSGRVMARYQRCHAGEVGDLASVRRPIVGGGARSRHGSELIKLIKVQCFERQSSWICLFTVTILC
jgi:hypothetical protein